MILSNAIISVILLKVRDRNGEVTVIHVVVVEETVVAIGVPSVVVAITEARPIIGTVLSAFPYG